MEGRDASAVCAGYRRDGARPASQWKYSLGRAFTFKIPLASRLRTLMLACVMHKAPVTFVALCFCFGLTASCGGSGGGDAWTGNPYPAPISQIVFSDDQVVRGNPFVVTVTISFTKENQEFAGMDVKYDNNTLTATVTPLCRDKKGSAGGSPLPPAIKGAVLNFLVAGEWTVSVVHAGGTETKSVTVIAES